MPFQHSRVCRYQALRPEWDIAEPRATALQNTTSTAGDGPDWTLQRAGDSLSWRLKTCPREQHTLLIHYSAQSRHDFLPGAVALRMNEAFRSGVLPLERGENTWLAVPIPASAFNVCGDRLYLRLCNSYAQVTIHGLYLSTYRLNLQEHRMWCWAAILNSLDHYYGHSQPRTQAEWACQVFGAGQCRKHTGCQQCQQAAYIHETLERNGYLQKVMETPASKADMIRELEAERPVVVTQKAAGDVYGHFLLVFGINPDGTWAVWNPRQPGLTATTYERLLENGTPRMKWVNTFFTCTPDLSSELGDSSETDKLASGVAISAPSAYLKSCQPT